VLYRAHGDVSKWSAAEIGVEDYAAGVDDAAERWAARLKQNASDALDPFTLGMLGRTRAARGVDGGPYRVHDDGARVLSQ